jgi:hypothetical protein
VLSVFPIIDVQSSWQYSIKTAAVILGANLIGVLLYQWRTRPRDQLARA